MADIILEIERHSILGMQIGYLEEIGKVLSIPIPMFLSLSIFLLPAGNDLSKLKKRCPSIQIALDGKYKLLVYIYLKKRLTFYTRIGDR